MKKKCKFNVHYTQWSVVLVLVLVLVRQEEEQEALDQASDLATKQQSSSHLLGSSGVAE